VSNDIIKLPHGLLEPEKPFKLFDMKKFQQNVNREMKRAYPDRLKLECQCISTIAFAKNEPELLDSPIWVMLINVVALEMLKAKMPVQGKLIHEKYNLIKRQPTLRGIDLSKKMSIFTLFFYRLHKISYSLISHKVNFKTNNSARKK
jgi:hypothetical protein